ncbi:MAG: ribonuclease H-like domain-containing protein [Treponema sp.]|jgi:uncharacterized protein YprB with RNaseH-like and TPR domain|nr:ribonuclease H-like domain-containing protein [Treponema sp.]
MANLASRLKKIRELGLAPASELSPREEEKKAPVKPDVKTSAKKRLPPRSAPGRSAKTPESTAPIPGEFNDWEAAGYQVLRRTLVKDMGSYGEIPAHLALLAPDLEGKNNLQYEDFLFFDLETTGLSGGAGTVAFLAAFGSFVTDKKSRVQLHIDQFLLMDYPGEADFIALVLDFIASKGNVYLSTYNGKTFDSQILKTRCLMNGFKPPVIKQLDLLYPARRLWKRILYSCSQAVVEAEILGIDRSDDVSGAFAPDIWFRFLRSRSSKKEQPDTEEASLNLLAICNHNVRDISGLAALFGAVVKIARDPLDGCGRYNGDSEHVAMMWRRAARVLPAQSGLPVTETAKTARALLELAAEDWPRASLRLALDDLRQGAREAGITRLYELLYRGGVRLAGYKNTGLSGDFRIVCPDTVKALALRRLAIDARKYPGKLPAKTFLDTALSLESLPNGLREELTLFVT